MRKNCELGRYVLSKCGADKKEFLSAVYKRRTQAKKHRLDVAQFGRSMVEMLGVLAIIGVLSVGGIAGYSKAMEKYKLNKHMQGLSLILQFALNFTSNLKPEEGLNINITRFFNKFDAIPDGFKYEDNNEKIIDVFDSSLILRSCTVHPTSHNFTFGYYIENTKSWFNICVNLINVAKAYKDQIHYLTVSNSDTPQTNYYGTIGCNSSRKCLDELSMDDVYEMCKIQGHENSYFAFSWF